MVFIQGNHKIFRCLDLINGFDSKNYSTHSGGGCPPPPPAEFLAKIPKHQNLKKIGKKGYNRGKLEKMRVIFLILVILITWGTPPPRSRVCPPT